MKTQIQAQITKLDSIRERADELADSDNETTASRYEAVSDCLQTAIDALEEALTEWDT